MRIMIYAASARQLKSGKYAIDITVRVESAEHLKSVMTKIENVSGVYSVERVYS